jgi:uncharacterized integral membrane protein
MALGRRGAGDDGRDERVVPEKGTGVTPTLLLVSALIVALIVFLAQNTETVPVEFLVWDVDAALFVVVLIAMAASAVVTLVVAGVWRRRRRRHRSEREELHRLRQDRTA